VSTAAAVGVLALGLLVTARLTRVITDDRIGLPLRQRVVVRFPAPPDDPGGFSLLAYLVHCRWCMSLWVAIPAALVVAFLLQDGWTALALAGALSCAFSYLTGLLVALEPED